jgi:hypothetical protein
LAGASSFDIPWVSKLFSFSLLDKKVPILACKARQTSVGSYILYSKIGLEKFELLR